MSAFIALVAVAALSWAMRISFTAVFEGDRLPESVRSRLDAVGPAAFAALLAGHVAGGDASALPTTVVALVVAGVLARITGSHLAAVVGAALAWWLMSVV